MSIEEEKRKARLEYKRVHYYKNKHRKNRVQGSLSHTEFREISRIAQSNGRTVFQQIWLESCAYRSQKSVPSKEVEIILRDLYRQLRGMANNINQLAHKSNAIGRLVEKHQTKKQLQEVEIFLQEFVRNPLGKGKSR